MTGLAGADLLVRRIRGGATLVADGSDDDAGLLPIELLLAPEAAEREIRDLAALGVGRLDWHTVDGVGRCGGNRLVAAGQSVGRIGQGGGPAESKHASSVRRCLRYRPVPSRA